MDPRPAVAPPPIVMFALNVAGIALGIIVWRTGRRLRAELQARL
jgi:hypothetical protein